MPTSTNVTNLKINELTEAQFDSAVQGGTIGANEISIITDLDNEAVQVDTLPTASASEEGKIYQFIGTTTASYTNGYFYKCVSDGQNPATYSWTQVDVQPTPSGLPSQSGNSGKFLTTDGTDASWGNAIANTATGTNAITILGTPTTRNNCINIGSSSQCSGGWGNYYAVAVGAEAKATNNNTVAIGGSAQASGDQSTAVGDTAKATSSYSMALGQRTEATASNSICIGWLAKATARGAIQLGSRTGGSVASNSDANTFKVGNANGNFEMMSADGTIPTDRFTTTPVADGTYVPTLTISSGVATRSWAAPSGGGGSSTSATATLATADWSSNTQTVNVTGVTSSNNVIVSAAPASQADYTAAGVICTAQGSGTLTFTCTTTPSSALTVNVLII